MLRLIKKHVAACSKRSEKDWKCKPANPSTKTVQCPFYIVGPDPLKPSGPRIKKHAGTSDERIAKAALFEFERSLYDPKPQTPRQATFTEAVELYIATKRHRSIARQKKLRLQLERMTKFLSDEFDHKAVTDVRNTDLQKFTQTWSGRYSTLKTERENLKGFWKWCFDSDLTPKNVAATLPTIGDPRNQKVQRIPTLTPDEIRAIIEASANCDHIYAKNGKEVTAQVRAFTLVQKYTGLAIGDVAKLRLDEVKGNDICVNRKKTGEKVWTFVPPFVVESLHSFSPDSPDYFFWTGDGTLHTRTSKWGARLQKLYAFAGVRVNEQLKVKRSGGKLKQKPDHMMVSAVTPHWWRHTFVRDLYLKDTPVEDIADLIGDDVETVRKYYSSFDELRKKKLEDRMKALWADDPLTKELSGQATHP